MTARGFRVWMVNFGWYLGEDHATAEEAIFAARRVGFECRIEDPEGNLVAGVSPLHGVTRFARKDGAR